MTLSPNWFLNATGQFQQIGSGQIGISTTTTTGFLTFVTKSTTINIAIPASTADTDGPSVAQGSSGVWLAMGNLTILNGGLGNDFYAKLWDGTTIADSGYVLVGANVATSMSFSGVFNSPANNIKLTVASADARGATILFAGASGTNGNNKDSTVTAIRIG